MSGMGDTGSNIAPPLPVESAQSMGGFGTNPADINFTGASPQDLQSYEQSLQGALNSLQQRVAAPNWANIAAGFLTPGPGGFFGELGQANKALGQFVEQRRQMALPMAQMQAQLAQAKIAMGQNQQAATLYEGLVSKYGTPDQIPLDVLTGAVAQTGAIAPNAPATKALLGELNAKQTAAGIPGLVAHSVSGELGANKGLTGVGLAPMFDLSSGAPRPGLSAEGVRATPQGGAPDVSVAFPSAGTPYAAPSNLMDPHAIPVTPGEPGTPTGANPLTLGTAPHAGGPTAFNLAGGAGAGTLGSLMSAWQAGQMTSPQVQAILGDMHARGELAGAGMDDQQYNQLMGALQNHAASGAAPLAPPSGPPAPAAGAVNAASSSPQAFDPSNPPLDLGALAPAQLPSLLQGASYNPASYVAPAGTVYPQEHQYQTALTQMGDIAGNPATLAAKTPAIQSVLTSLQSGSPQQQALAQQQFQDVVGRIAKQPAVLKGILSAVGPVSAKFFDVDFSKWVQASIPSSEQTMADNVARAMAETAALDSQFRGMPIGHGITHAQSEVVTGGLPTSQFTPKAALLSLLQADLNAKRYQTLYQGYTRLSPYLMKTPQGALNNTPAMTFFSSPWYGSVNDHYDTLLQGLDKKLGH